MLTGKKLPPGWVRVKGRIWGSGVGSVFAWVGAGAECGVVGAGWWHGWRDKAHAGLCEGVNCEQAHAKGDEIVQLDFAWGRGVEDELEVCGKLGIQDLPFDFAGQREARAMARRAARAARSAGERFLDLPRLRRPRAWAAGFFIRLKSGICVRYDLMPVEGAGAIAFVPFGNIAGAVGLRARRIIKRNFVGQRRRRFRLPQCGAVFRFLAVHDGEGNVTDIIPGGDERGHDVLRVLGGTSEPTRAAANQEREKTVELDEGRKIFHGQPAIAGLDELL